MPVITAVSSSAGLLLFVVVLVGISSGLILASEALVRVGFSLLRNHVAARRTAFRFEIAEKASDWCHDYSLQSCCYLYCNTTVPVL
jgi:hypothetical protein